MMRDSDHKDLPKVFYGMALFGEETAYLSILPMFISPHDYQAIFEVTLSKEELDDPMALYVNDRKAHPEFKMYSLLVTEPFVLTDLVPSANPRDPQPTPLRSSFPGNIWRGHFEASPPMEHSVPQGQPVPGLDNTSIRVANVILFRKLDPYAQALPRLTYVLFGKAQELFLAHVISQPPDFDQVLGVEVVNHQFTGDELRRGLLVIFERANSADRKIREQEQVTGQVQVLGENASRPFEVQFKAGTEFYFEKGDLKSGPGLPTHV
jgi:hypothetical protein